MFQSFDLLIRGGTLASYTGQFEADIGVVDGKIRAIGDLSDAVSEDVFDAKGLAILPGVIDTHVHFREPGADYKEDLESGARGAVLGGVTSVFDMPDTKPVTASANDIKDKFNRAKNRMWCDHALFVGATADNAGALTWMEKVQGIAGVAVYADDCNDAFSPNDDETLFKIFSHGSRRLSIIGADQAMRRAIKLAKQAGRKLHLTALSTAKDIETAGHHKDITSVAVTPQHLTFALPAAHEQLGAKARINPALGVEYDQSALWQGILNGAVDCIASGHAPHTVEEKLQNSSPEGVPAVQTLLPVMLTHVANGKLSLARLVDLTSAGPARLFGLRDKGRLAVGYDADFVIVDLKKKWTIENSWIVSKSAWSPFDGFEAIGKPVATLVRGSIVVRDGQMASQALGKPIRFLDMVKADMQDHEI